MGRCDNYPDWTYDRDPRAPWNEPDDSKLKEDAIKLAKEDAEEISERWWDFVLNKFNLYGEEDCVVYNKCLELLQDESFIDEFFDANEDFFVDKCVSNAEDLPDKNDDY